MPKVKDPKPNESPIFDTKNTQYPTCDVTAPRKDPKPEDDESDLIFMGHKTKDMTKGGLLEVVKYLRWELKCMHGIVEQPPEIDIDICEQKEGSKSGFRQGEHEGRLRCNTCGATVEDSGQMEALDKAGIEQKPTSEILDETLEVLMKKAQAYENITASSEWKSPLPRKEVISIQPGDVVVMSSKCDYSLKERNTLNDGLKALFPYNKSVLLINGDSLEVYREQGKVADKGDCTCEGGPKWESVRGTDRCSECGGLREQVKDE
jgi:hypothetical protein